MKKFLLLLSLLIPLFTFGQQTSYDYAPPGSVSKTVTVRVTPGDSLSKKYWIGFASNDFQRIPTWAQMRAAIAGGSGGSFLPLSFPSTQKLTTNGFGLKMNGNGKRQLLFDINSTTSDTGAPLGIISFQDTSGVAMDGEIKASRVTQVGPINSYFRYAQSVITALDTDRNAVPNIGYVRDTFATKKLYVPYTGAIGDVTLGTHELSAQSIAVTGTAGAGVLKLPTQSSTPTTPSSGTHNIYTNAAGQFSVQGSNGNAFSLSRSLLTASRVFTFPDRAGTIALTTDAVPQLIATSYGVVADGTTDNTTAIAAIETACPSTGCEIFWPAGSIKATHIDIQKPQTWVGMGGIIPSAATPAITTFTTSATTGHFITINANRVKFQDVAFGCTGVATSGSGIYIQSCIGFRMTHCSLYNFYDQFNYRSGYDWVMDGNVFFKPVHHNLMVADSALADAGDQSLINNYFYSTVSTSGVFQLEYTSGGGLKLVNNKFNGVAGLYYGAIHINIGASTVDLFAANNSIENTTDYGILGTVQTGKTYATIILTGNEISGSGYPVYFDPSIGGGTLNQIMIGDNILTDASTTHACITIKNTGNITIGLNQYNGLTPFDLGTGNSSPINVQRLTQPISLSGTTPTYDLNKSNYQNLTLSGATTLTLANILNGDTWYLAVLQDATGGRTLSVTGAYAIGGGSIDPTPNSISYIVGHQNIITIFSNVAGTFSSLTTTGSSGAATLTSGVLNIPNYTATGLGAVPTSRTVAGFALSGNVSLATLTPGTHLSGSAYDGSTNRTWTTDATATPTASVITAYDANSNLSANSFIPGYTTTATAAGTTTLTVASAYQQFFTGSTTQTVTLPVASTLVLGQQFKVVNNSSGVVTVNSSGANAVQAMAASTSAIYTCILTSGTSAASWSVAYAAPSGGSTNIYNTDGTLTGARTITSGGFALTVNPTTNFTYYSGSGSLSTQIHLTDATNGNAYLSGNGLLKGGGGTGSKFGTISGANSDVSSTNSFITLGTSTAQFQSQTTMTINTNTGHAAILFGDNTTGSMSMQFGSTDGNGFTVPQNFYIGSGTTTPFFKIYSAGTGGVSVGGTPVDAGANNLYIQGTARVAALTASQGVFTDASKNLISKSVSSISSSADLTAQSAAGTITSVTSAAANSTYDVSGYINVTAVTTDVIQAQITYTDENNTAQTISLSSISAIGNNSIGVQTIRVKASTTITLKTNLTTSIGSIAFDAGGYIKLDY